MHWRSRWARVSGPGNRVGSRFGDLVTLLLAHTAKEAVVQGIHLPLGHRRPSSVTSVIDPAWHRRGSDQTVFDEAEQSGLRAFFTTEKARISENLNYNPIVPLAMSVSPKPLKL